MRPIYCFPIWPELSDPHYRHAADGPLDPNWDRSMFCCYDDGDDGDGIDGPIR